MKNLKMVLILIVSLTFYFTVSAYTRPRVKLISGDVKVSYDLKTFYEIKINDILTESSKLKTGKNSYAVISYNDSLIKVNENSIFSLKSLKEKKDGFAVRFKLFVGSIFTKISKLKKNSEFDVETPTAVVGVRGTEFEVSTKQDDTTVKVFDGKVRFANLKDRRKAIILTRNQIAGIRKGRLKRLKIRLTKSEVHKFKNEFKKIKQRLKNKRINKTKPLKLKKHAKPLQQKKVIKKIKRIKRR